MAKLDKSQSEELTKFEKHLLRFYDTVEKIVASDLPNERKVACIEAMYLAFCTATGKKPDYELLNTNNK